MGRPKSLSIISLFCGAGGLDLGFEEAGFLPTVAYDLMPAAVNTYNANRKPRKPARIADLSNLSAHTIVSHLKGTIPVGVIGGPPCQAFSVSNTSYREDDNRRIFPACYALLLRALNDLFTLKFFVFENVEGITLKRNSEDLTRFRHLFESAGFRLYETVLNAKDFGVPQNRPRVFIVGINESVFGARIYKFPNPLEAEPITVRDAFEGAFGNTPWPEPAFFSRQLRRENIPFHPNHWTMMPKSSRFKDVLGTGGHIASRSFRVLDWGKPSWTVAYGNREIHVHPEGRRRLSIYEAMVLQGFPSRYELLGTLSDQVTMVSNAVPPQVGFHIARSLRTFLKNGSRKR